MKTVWGIALGFALLAVSAGGVDRPLAGSQGHMNAVETGFEATCMGGAASPPRSTKVGRFIPTTPGAATTPRRKTWPLNEGREVHPDDTRRCYYATSQDVAAQRRSGG